MGTAICTHLIVGASSLLVLVLIYNCLGLLGKYPFLAHWMDLNPYLPMFGPQFLKISRVQQEILFIILHVASKLGYSRNPFFFSYQSNPPSKVGMMYGPFPLRGLLKGKSCTHGGCIPPRGYPKTCTCVRGMNQGPLASQHFKIIYYQGQGANTPPQHKMCSMGMLDGYNSHA